MTEKKSVQAEYGKELAVENEQNQIITGAWATKQMEKRPYSIGYMKDPFEGVRKVPLPNLQRHMALFGLTGYGKSTALRNLSIQVNEESSFVYVDPKGDVKRELKLQLAEEDYEDINILRMGEDTSAIGLGLFTQDTEDDIGRAVNVFINLLKEKCGGYWGSRMDSIARSLVQGMIESDISYSVRDFERLMNDADERETLIESLDNEGIKRPLKEIESMGSEELEPLVRRVSELMSDEVLVNFLSEGDEETFSFDYLKSCFSDEESFVVDTSGLFESLVGEAFVFALWEAVKREYVEEREDVTLFLDELDSLSLGSGWISNMLSKARSFKLRIVVSCQQLQQLPESVQNSVLGTCGTVLIMRTADPQEANTFANLFDEYGRNHFLNLGRFKFTARISNKYSESVAVTGTLFPEYRK